MNDVYHPLFPASPGYVPLVITEVSGDHQVLPNEDVISSSGNNNITFPDENDVIKDITVASDSGTATCLADVAIDSPSTVTAGASETFYLARGQWNHR